MVKINRYSVAPCGRGNKVLLFPGQEKTVDQRKRKRACIKEEQYETFMVNTKLMNNIKKKLGKAQFFKAETDFMHIKLRPRLEDGLIDLDDLPSKAKLTTFEEAIQHLQKNNLETLPSIKQYEAKVKALKNNRITLDFDLQALGTCRNKNRVRSRINQATKKRGLMESKAITLQREKQVIDSEILREEKLYYDLCKKMESRNNEISKLIVENRCLLKLRKQKLDTLLNLEQDFDDAKEMLNRQLALLKKDAKYLSKEDFTINCDAIIKKHSRCYRKKKSMKTCPVKKRKSPKVEMVIVNDVPQDVKSNNIPRKKSQKKNQFGIYQEVHELQARFMELTMMYKKMHYETAGRIKQLKKKTKSSSPLAVKKKMLAARIKKQKNIWKEKTVQLKVGTRVMKATQKNMHHEYAEIRRIFRFAERTVERIAEAVMTGEEQDATMKELKTQAVLIESEKDMEESTSAVNKDTLPTVMKLIDEKLTRWLKQYKVKEYK
ncbi:uncharacterized protein LOC103515212 isoform X2 [Diaphorina citri]|uniref:Uncharacterized protein LOC103515212 isoform X1 n=1 Tax=Diaphorina citri TaxID=121845 RepID=A0A1S3DBI1_DIACI|nr:uncharacterized protein LOC103515212 isoform X1 [Diaphorina citri]XP_026683774.1 uncharacterized protein LOC103515212 isoform X2 [Diaphorina citri]